MLRQQNSLCFRARLRHKSRALQRVYAKLNLVRNTNSYQRPGSKQKWIPTSRDSAAENRQNGWWKYFLIKLVWKLRCAPCVDNRSSSDSFLTTQLKRRFRDQTLSLTHSSSQKSFSTFYDWTSIRVIKELSMNGMASTLWAANNLCNQKYVGPTSWIWFFFLGKYFFIKTESHCASSYFPERTRARLSTPESTLQANNVS